MLPALFLPAASPRVDAGGAASFQTQGQPSEDRVVILVGGDVLPESSWRGPQDASHFLDNMREEFGRADLVFVNLEEPITSSRKVTPFKKRTEVAAGREYILRARNSSIPGELKQAGVGLVGLANNHMMDYTVVGLRDTLNAFRRAELPVVGAGLKLDAERPFVFEKQKRRVALLAFSDVVPPNSNATDTKLGIATTKDQEDLVQAIRRARGTADFVVLMIHWGGQGRHLITTRQRQLAQAAAQAGCDVIVGMHPHVLQGIEYMGRTAVIYSVGNFAFASTRPASQECVLARLTLGPERLEGLDLVPVFISSSGIPTPARGNQGKQILAHVDGFCRMFNSQVRDGQLGPSPVRERLVYDLTGQKAAHRPPKRSRARRKSGSKSQGSGP